MSETPSTQQPGSGRSVLAEAVPILLLTLVLGGMATAFVTPWLPSSPIHGSDLDRYNPVRDGTAYLSVERDADGAVIRWQSENVQRVPGLKASSQWRGGPAGALDDFVSDGDELTTSERARRLEGVEALSVAVREVGPDLDSTFESFSVLDQDGQWLLGLIDGATGTETILDPPLHVRPRDLPPGAAWTSEGNLGASGAIYQFTGEVIGQSSHTGGLGTFADCLEIRERLVISVDGEVTGDTTTETWSCAEVGAVVEAVDRDADGVETARRTLVATTGGSTAAEDLPPRDGDTPDVACVVADVGCAPDAADPESWSVRRFGSAHQSFAAAEATVPVLWVPTDPPVVVAAGHRGDLVAFDAMSGDLAWRFHPAGTIQGPPVYADGRILFGATDKRLYALDARGLFLWAHQTSDSVSSRPLVVDGVVVVGSEDRDVHGVDLETGRPRWRVTTGGPIASSAADVGGAVVIGGDDGAVRVIDPTSGDVLAQVDLGDAIVAPVAAAADGVAVVATSGAVVAALAVPTGDLLWEVEVDGAVTAEPVVHDGQVHVVDDSGSVTVLDVANGSLVRTFAGDYVGAPLPLAGGTLVTTSGGTIELVMEDGETSSWDAGEARGASDPDPTFAIGPTVGGGWIWTVDRGGVLRRLGVPTDTSVDLSPRWLASLTDEPFSSAGSAPVTTPVEWDGSAIALDGAGTVYLTDPAAGTTEVLGVLDSFSPYVEPVVVDDVLLLAGPSSLRAVGLPGLDLLWEAAGVGPTARPPTVVADTVLYASGSTDDDGTGELQLAALDLVDGAERWSVPLGPAPIAGGVAVVDDLVIAGTPLSGLDLATGRATWTADTAGEATLGSPGTTADGSIVVMASLSLDGSDRSTLRALDAASGATIWQTDLGDHALDLTDAVTVIQDVVVVPTFEGGVIAHDVATGEPRWSYDPPVAVLGNVSVLDGDIWLSLENGSVVVLDTSTGAVVARFAEIDLPLQSQGRAQRPGQVGDQALVSLGFMYVGFDAASVR